MISIWGKKCQQSNRETKWSRLPCFGSAVQNGGTFHTFRQEIGELLPKNTARTAKIQLEGQHQIFGEYLQNWTSLYPPELAEKQAIED